MAERLTSSYPNTRKKLINNEPFEYAHLVKFERPSKEYKKGKPSTNAVNYAYFTDAARDLSFDDQSKDNDGTANGTQTYIANKISKIGGYSETIEARASGMQLEVSAETLNNSINSTAITAVASSMTITIAAAVGKDAPNFIDKGFTEGDKIYVSGGTNGGRYFNVTGIKSSGTTLVVTNIGTTGATQLVDQSTGTSITISIVSDELKGALTEVNDTDTLKSYVNRDVWVYKAFINPEDGTILDNLPVLIFKE